MCGYPWPGSLAELDSVLELAAFNAEGGVIEREFLAGELRDPAARRPEPAYAAPISIIQGVQPRSAAWLARVQCWLSKHNP